MMRQKRVANPPPKPLLIWDGDCRFCSHWIARWRIETAGTVDYATSQSIGATYPEITSDDYQRSVVLIEPNGEASFGARAVFRSLSHVPRRRWLLWCYEHLPGFAAVSEFLYGTVARNRVLASRATDLLSTKDR